MPKLPQSRCARLGLLPLLLASTGCDMFGAATGEDGREASGEVLEGSISDAMLPVEGLRSQPPLAAPEAGEGTGGEAEEGPPGEGDAEQPTDGEAPAPVAPAEQVEAAGE